MSDEHEIPAAEAPSTPAPPLVGLPVEKVPGAYADYPADPADMDARPPQTHGTQLDAPPIPLIGAVSFGGLVTSSELNPIGAGQSVTIGEHGRPRPRTTMIGLYSSDGTFGQTVQILGDNMENSLSGGAFLPIGAGQPGILWLPLRRVTVRNASAAPISLGVVILHYDY